MKVVSCVYNTLTRFVDRVKRLKYVLLILLAMAIGFVFPVVQKLLSCTELTDGEQYGSYVLGAVIVFLIYMIRKAEKRESEKRVEEMTQALKKLLESEGLTKGKEK